MAMSLFQIVLVYFCISQVELILTKKSNMKSVFIAVSTRENHHNYLLPIVIKTWFSLATKNTWFFTTAMNDWIKLATHDHLVVTDCESCVPTTKECFCNHIQTEMMFYYDHYETKWFCHFDDTNFVNIPALVKELKKYNHTTDWYLGRRYIAPHHAVPQEQTFWFGRLSAGCCISRSLLMKLKPRICRKNFFQTCMSLETADQALGFIIEGEGVQFTHLDTLHDNIEDLSMIKLKDLRQQITLSFKDKNIVNVPGFSTTVDPTRFLSLHCYLLLPYPAYDEATVCTESGYRGLISDNTTKVYKSWSVNEMFSLTF